MAPHRVTTAGGPSFGDCYSTAYTAHDPFTCQLQVLDKDAGMTDMSMSRDELELMQRLQRLCNRIPDFAVGFASEELSAEAEIAFAREMAAVAEGIHRHANAPRAMTIDGELVAFVTDAGLGSVSGPAALPAGAAGAGYGSGGRFVAG
jgi:hypothetical protein